MTDNPIEDRRFTDDEVREILKRAVSTSSTRALLKRDGLSLSELKAIGREVGIEAARVEDAARAVTLETGNRPSKFLGGPVIMNFERKVDGVFDRDDTHEILSRIRQIIGSQGQVEEVHGSLEWSTKGEVGERYVTLTPREGATTIRTSANLSNLAVLTYVPAGAMGIIASAVGLTKYVKDGSEAGLIVFLLVLPVLYAILRTIYHQVAGAEAERLRKVVDDLARLVEGPGD